MGSSPTAQSKLFLKCFSCGAGGGTRPFIPAFAIQICLISLAIQAYSASPNHTVSDSFGVRFGVRWPTPDFFHLLPRPGHGPGIPRIVDRQTGKAGCC